MNAETKHTPGPWSRAPYINSHAQSLTVVDVEGSEVATVRGWDGDGDHREADAHLIAAAPDLLEALRDVTDALAEHLSDLGRDHPEQAPRVQRARAAIAKATGAGA